MPDLSDLEAELEVLRAVVDTIDRGEAPALTGDDGDDPLRSAASTPPPSLWRLLPDQGPHSRCSTRGCDERAVAMHDGRRKRWACRKHLPDGAVPR